MTVIVCSITSPQFSIESVRAYPAERAGVLPIGLILRVLRIRNRDGIADV